jgi:hypothetical protein
MKNKVTNNLDTIDKLIEHNPIKDLNKNYENKLLEKFKNSFTETQQQLFVSSFYCYLKYNKYKDFVIDLDDVWKWLEYGRKEEAKRLLIKYFKEDGDYKVEKAAPCFHGAAFSKNYGGAGLNKQRIMLSVNTFKKFCLKSNTKKADEIHDYYIKLEDIVQDTLQEQTNELKLQLTEKENENEKLLKESSNKDLLLKNQKEIERHSILLKEYGEVGNIVYIIRVKTIKTGVYIIKIGESRVGLSSRYKEHKQNYEESVILDCFTAYRCKYFESFIHKKLSKYRVKDLDGHEKENELFMVGYELTYKHVLDIINNNIKNYNEWHHFKEFNELKEENRKLKEKLESKQKEESNNSIEDIEKRITKLEETVEQNFNIILDKLNRLTTKTTTNFNTVLPTIGDRVQKINPESLELIDVYENISECIKENPKYCRSSINKAIKQNTIYRGYRWLLVNRNLDKNKVHNIEPTKEIIHQKLGYIAKLNIDQSYIMNVYLNRKVAALSNGYFSVNSLDEIVKHKKLSNGYYYILYEECSEILQEKFLKKINESKVILYENGVGRFDLDMKLLNEYRSKHDCIKSLGISDKSIRKAIELNIPYNGYYYQYIGNKTIV